MDYTTGPVAPLTFGDAVKRVFSKYAEFGGRASRAEFWWFYLFLFIVNTALGILIAVTDSGIFSWIDWVFGVATIVPMLSVSWRRLHDTGRGGGWWFINLIPLVGNIIFIIFCVQPGETVANRFGPVPAN